MKVTVVNITNPVFSSEDQKNIDCILTLSTFPTPIPFTASADDIEEHGRIIYQSIMSGNYGAIGAYVPPPPPATP
jgi:hypothetical protein